jgi:hypothetical protein
MSRPADDAARVRRTAQVTVVVMAVMFGLVPFVVVLMATQGPWWFVPAMVLLVMLDELRQRSERRGGRIQPEAPGNASLRATLADRFRVSGQEMAAFSPSGWKRVWNATGWPAGGQILVGAFVGVSAAVAARLALAWL